MRLWFRWARRDVRAHALQVVAIAFIVALGSGVYSGLESTAAWQRSSYDANFRSLRMHDLRVSLAQGSFVDGGALEAAIRSIPGRDELAAVAPRLIVPTQIELDTDDEPIVTAARLVGVDVSRAGSRVDAISHEGGQGLRAFDTGRDVAVLGAQFADYHDLPDRGRLRLSTGEHLAYVGLGTSPDNFLVTDERGVFLTQGSLALVYAPLETAQRIAGKPGAANDVVIRLLPGSRVEMIRHQIAASLDERFADVGTTITDRRDDSSYRQLYGSIRRHQRLFDVFAVLVLVAAAFVAFSFTHRLMETQRREMGIGMALGVRPIQLAIRPLLVAVQLGLLGVVLGIGVGIVMSAAMGSILRELTPLPTWHFPVQFGLYAQGAALAITVPVVAALLPVWRAVRVPPVEAIRTGTWAGASGRHAPVTARLVLPRRTTGRVPLGNVLRAPWRTLVTAVGVAIAITILVGLMGLVDSFFATADVAESEGRRGGGDQTLVELDGFYPRDSTVVRAIRRSPLVAHIEPALQAAGGLRHGDTRFPVRLEVRDLRSSRWSPTIEHRYEVTPPAVLLTDTAALQLGVEPGDDVTVRYPRRQGPTSYRFAESTVPVLGTNPFPARGLVYLDDGAAALARVEGLTNLLVVTPVHGAGADELERALFGQTGVASVQPVVGLVKTVREQLDRVFAALFVVEAAVFLLALLIAYNAARINADERAREDATMLAFGLRVHTVVRMKVVEGILVGALGTALGLVSGIVLLRWLVRDLLPRTIPEIGIVTHLDLVTIAIAFALGIGAVGVAPLLNATRLRHMDLPGVLRVVE